MMTKEQREAIKENVGYGTVLEPNKTIGCTDMGTSTLGRVEPGDLFAHYGVFGLKLATSEDIESDREFSHFNRGVWNLRRTMTLKSRPSRPSVQQNHTKVWLTYEEVFDLIEAGFKLLPHSMSALGAQGLDERRAKIWLEPPGGQHVNFDLVRYYFDVGAAKLLKLKLEAADLLRPNSEPYGDELDQKLLPFFEMVPEYAKMITRVY